MIRRLPLPLLALGVLLCACDPAPTPSPTPAQLAARVYTLSPQQAPGYTRGTDNTITPQTLADQDNDPALAARLTALGWRDGAIEVFAPPQNSTAHLPFVTLSSQAIIFDTAAGASSFFSDEQKRIHTAPARGSITDLAGVSPSGIDALVAYDSTQPSANPGEGAQRAFIALLRKGQVVVELYGFAGANPVTPRDFTVLITAEEELLQTPPQ